MENDGTRIAIIGRNGQLAQALQEHYPGAVALGRGELDVTNEDALRAYEWRGVDVIINAAGYTKVDEAETPQGKEQAWAVNDRAVEALARLCAENEITLVHVSSDYVFDGTKSPHTEEETPNPLNVYGETKAAGDAAASDAPKNYVIRTSWVIGDGNNFVRTMIGLANKNISPRVIHDQIGRLTFVDTLVEGIDHLLKTQAPYGIYNITNDGKPASWADITRAIFDDLGRRDLTVTNTTTAEYLADKPNAATRPLGSEFDLSKIRATGFRPRDWRPALREYIQGELAQAKQQEAA